MRDVVLDATVVTPWFDPKRPAEDPARKVRAEFEAGALAVTVPSLLLLEVVNVAGRQWRWGEGALTELATALAEIGFEVADPALTSVAAWVTRGLTAYDAAYVALAEARAVPLLTTDREILAVARDVARSPTRALEE